MVATKGDETMTELQNMVMRATIDNDYQVPGAEVGTPVWAWSVSDAMACDPASRGGAIASCVKAGWIEHTGRFGDEDTITLTAAGAEAAGI